jgi:hypothetical protein
LQEPLVLALQLVVEDNPIDAGAAFLEALGFAFIRTVDLRVVLDFARLLQLGIKRLAMVLALIAIAAVRFEQVASTVGQYDGDILVAVDRNRANEALLAKVSEIALARVGWPAVVVAQVARRHHAERADDAQRTGFGTAKGVLAVTLMDQLALQSAGKVELLYEGVSGIDRVALA